MWLPANLRPSWGKINTNHVSVDNRERTQRQKFPIRVSSLHLQLDCLIVRKFRWTRDIQDNLAMKPSWASLGQIDFNPWKGTQFSTFPAVRITSQNFCLPIIFLGLKFFAIDWSLYIPKMVFILTPPLRGSWSHSRSRTRTAYTSFETMPRAATLFWQASVVSNLWPRGRYVAKLW